MEVNSGKKKKEKNVNKNMKGGKQRCFIVIVRSE